MNDYLIHGGPGSGRYPLGSGERPYQKFEGSKKRIGLLGKVKEVKRKRIEKRVKQAEREATKRKLADEEIDKILEANRERVLKSGSAKELMKYKGRLSNNELQYATSRLRMERDLANMAQDEKRSAINKVDRVMKNVKTGNEWLKTGTELYNLTASIYNATPDGQKKPLPLVKKDGGGQKKKDNN